MTDREKVIKGLECLSSYEVCYGSDCPYYNFDCTQKIAQDVLELLKEQKGVPYVFDADGETVCGVCGCHFDKAYSNCPKCGKKVDWNAAD